MRAPVIESRENPKVKAAIKARKSPSRGAFFIEGPNLIEAAFRAGAGLDPVFFTAPFTEKAKGKDLLKEISKRAECFEIPERLMASLSGTEAPQGIAAIASCKEVLLEDISFRGMPLLAVSAGIKEPGNLGALIRTADAAGADAVIVLSGSVSPYNGKALRATAGSFFNLPVTGADFKTFQLWLERTGIKLCATLPDAENSIYETDLKIPLAVCFGEEAHGIGREIIKSADISVRIPILGRAESLNVAASSAVVLYEAIRQRGEI